MGVDHKLLKTSENFKGLDLRSSDVMRSQEYSTDMRNAEYRISGAINKRKGFTNKRNTDFIKGMTTFKNISSNGAVTDELIYVENANIKKEVSFDIVTYRQNNITGTPVQLQFEKLTDEVLGNAIEITATDNSLGTEYYNKTFTSSDNIQSFITDFTYNTSLPSNNSTSYVSYDNIDYTQCKILWSGAHVEYSYSSSFELSPWDLNRTTSYIYLYIPTSEISSQERQNILNYITFAREDISEERITNTGFEVFNRLLSWGDDRLLLSKSYVSLKEGTFSNNDTIFTETTGQGDPEYIEFRIRPFYTVDPLPIYYSYSGIYYYKNITFTSSSYSTSIRYKYGYNYLRNMVTGFNPPYTRSNFRFMWAAAILDTYAEASTSNPTYDFYHSWVNKYYNTSTNDRHYSITLQEMLDGYNYNCNNMYGTTVLNTGHIIDTLPISSDGVLSNIILDIRNINNETSSQFLSESIISLNTNTTEISNNASSTFPTKVTTGFIEEAVGNLSWTSSDYEDILTENVNFASINNVLYISNGIDELLKYDGDDVYRAGLPNCSKDIATFSFNTTSTDYLHDINPGQVEYYTVDDSYYVNNSPDPDNPVDEALPANKKYLIEFNSGSNYNIKVANEGSDYPSTWTTRAYSTAGVTKVISGTGLQIEVLTDSAGGIKNYYTVEKGKSYKGEDDNGNAQNYINVTKKLFTYATGDDVITYGRVDIVDVSSQVREKTYEYRFAYEYTDYKGNIISSQPSDPVKLVVGSARSVNLTFPSTISDLSTFKTNGLFDTAWQEANGVTFPTTLTDDNYPIEKLDAENRLRILVYRSKGYSPIAGEVVGQYYKIADLQYDAGTATTFTDTYHDEPNDAEAATQYDPVINPFLAFVEPIKRKDPPPKGKYLTVFKNCLVIAGQNDNVNNVQYSLPKNFTTGEIGSEYFPDDDNGIVVESPFGSKITAISALRDALFVFHKDSIFSVTGNINQLELPSVNLLTKEGGVGCTSQASIEEFKGGLAFVSHTGVFSISNQGLSEISEIIKPLFLQDKFIKEKAITYNWTDRNLLLICIPDYIVQGDQEYNTVTDTMEAYISKDSLILAFDYYRGAWLRWDTIEFTNGITEVSGNLNFAQLTNTTNTLATVNNQGDTDDYSDNGSPINFVYETNWESLGDPTTPKKFLRIKVHSFDTDGVFESPGFLLEAGIQKNYQNYNEGKITFDFGAITGGGWGNFAWGTDSWGSIASQYLKSKLPTGKARSFKIRFANNENNENVLITNYELEIAAPYRTEIKE